MGIESTLRKLSYTYESRISCALVKTHLIVESAIKTAEEVKFRLWVSVRYICELW